MHDVMQVVRSSSYIDVIRVKESCVNNCYSGMDYTFDGLFSYEIVYHWPGGPNMVSGTLIGTFFSKGHFIAASGGFGAYPQGTLRRVGFKAGENYDVEELQTTLDRHSDPSHLP